MIWGKRAAWAVLAAAVLTGWMPVLAAEAEDAEPDRPGLLLLYHKGYQNEQVYMRSLFNLIATFGTSITPVNVEEQNPQDADLVNEVARARYIVLLADRDGSQKLPQLWRGTVRDSAASLYFMGENPGDVFGDEGGGSAKSMGRDSIITSTTNVSNVSGNAVASATTLLIHGKSYPLDVSLDIPNYHLPAPTEHVYSEVSNGTVQSPFISSTHVGVRKRLIFLCARYTAFYELSFAIADSLFDFFGAEVEPKHEAYVRIEDIHPERDPEEIRKIVEFLHGEGVPFLLAVIPIYQSGGERVTLTDRPELVKALQEAQASGGTIVQHGTTHQYYASETGEGYEFWDSIRKGPIPDEDRYVTDKLELGLQTLLANKLYPVAFEPPHYAMTRHGYEITARYYSTVVGNLQITDTSFVTTEPPYSILHSYQGGLTFYPENGGYVSGDEPTVIPEMLANLRKVEIVRRSQSGVFFHSYLPLDDLKRLVKGMKEQHLAFFNLRAHSNQVRTPWGTITTQDGKLQTDVKLPGAQPTRQAAPSSTEQKLSNFVAWGVVSVVTTVIAVFLIQVRLLRRRRRARLFEERMEGGES
ncbi:polysaccharide deacetylase family protein [Tumebacillus flagellatus]|uniref:DUF2334 domain-containing protein n=1 Tax=Tumebacillus flagellatus TaxID=1157490 RepID=A0A074LGF7_9BACL|nr:polysaccharide deacetylase family protein [Tumebacillus flagellatus]KEO81316.1 hypothetical protein EL26_21420 [Tumebacillus flagellatus]